MKPPIRIADWICTYTCDILCRLTRLGKRKAILVIIAWFGGSAYHGKFELNILPLGWHHLYWSTLHYLNGSLLTLLL